MKFITLNDLYTQIDEVHLSNIVGGDQTIVDRAELRAISYIKSLLSAKFDMDFEFRPFVEYEVNKVYADYQRLRLSYNESNYDYSQLYDVALLDYGFTLTTDGLYNGEDQMMIVKSPNLIPSELIDSYSDNTQIAYYSGGNPKNRLLTTDSFKYSISNPLYDNTLGRIVCSTGDLPGDTYYQDDKLYNYYNVEKNQNTDGTYDWTPIDFPNVLIGSMPSIIGDLDYFEQYRFTMLEDTVHILPDDRHPVLLKMVADIMVYEMCSRVAPRQMNETIKARYEDTIKMIKDILNGKFNINFKEIASNAPLTRGSRVRFGSSYSSWKNQY